MSKNPAIDRSVEIAKSFREKAPQLSCNALTAYGIELSTRYAKCGEMKEMLHFAELAAFAGVAPFVKSLFYDTKAGLCVFRWHGQVDPETDARLRQCANESITQYQWVDGGIGGKVFSQDEPDIESDLN